MSALCLFALPSSTALAAEPSGIAQAPAESSDAPDALDENALGQPAHHQVTEYVSAAAGPSKPSLSSHRNNAIYLQDAGPSDPFRDLTTVEEMFFAGGLCLTGMLVIGVVLRVLIRARRVERHQALLNMTHSEIEKERARRQQSAYDEFPEDMLLDGPSPSTMGYHQGLDDGKILEMMHALGPYLYGTDDSARAKAIMVLGRCVALLAPEHRLDWAFLLEDFCDDAHVPAQCAAIIALGAAVPYLEQEYRQHPLMMLHVKSKSVNRRVRESAERALEALPARMHHVPRSALQ